mmetsp:Transcript_13004/g.23994  ORF Transcript_13004/g.23994 Transcript_13004/m.23994 type:complete len:179 (-) Transcript_13004:34-570(-)
MRSSMFTITRTALRLNSRTLFARPSRISSHHNQHSSSITRYISSKTDAAIDKDKTTGDNKPSKKGLFGKFKDLWKDYGYKAVACYASLYFLNLGGLAIALETDVLHLHDFGYDAPAVLDMICGKYEELTGRKELGMIIHEHPRYGILAIALFLNDFFEPLRIGATIYILSKLPKKVHK